MTQGFGFDSPTNRVAIELNELMNIFEGAGFTHKEAFKLVKAAWKAHTTEIETRTRGRE